MYRGLAIQGNRRVVFRLETRLLFLQPNRFYPLGKCRVFGGVVSRIEEIKARLKSGNQTLFVTDDLSYLLAQLEKRDRALAVAKSNIHFECSCVTESCYQCRCIAAIQEILGESG